MDIQVNCKLHKNIDPNYFSAIFYNFKLDQNSFL